MRVPGFLKYSFKNPQNPCSTIAYLVVVSNLQNLTCVVRPFVVTIFENVATNSVKM